MPRLLGPAFFKPGMTVWLGLGSSLMLIHAPWSLYFKASERKSIYKCLLFPRSCISVRAVARSSVMLLELSDVTHCMSRSHVRWLREVSLPSWHPSPDVSCQASLIFSIASLCQSSVQSVISMSKSEYWYNHQHPSFTSHCSGFTVYCFTKVTFDFTPSSLRTSYIVND